MNRSVEDLLTRINEENIDNDFILDLIIFDEEKRKDPKEPLISKEYELFKDIHSTSLPIIGQVGLSNLDRNSDPNLKCRVGQ